MSDYDLHRSVQSRTSEVTAPRTSKALTMWDGWTSQSSSGEACARILSTQTSELQVQGLGARPSTYPQTDLLSSWVSGFPSLGLSQAAGMVAALEHDQPPQSTQRYHDELSRLHICSTSSQESPDGVAQSIDSSQLIIDRCTDERIMRPSPKFFAVTAGSNKSEESTLYLRSTGGSSQSSSFDKMQRSSSSTEQGQHRVRFPERDLSLRTSSVGQMMQHMVGQYESNSEHTSWTKGAITSSSFSHMQPCDSQQQLRRPILQDDPTGISTSVESVILHQPRPADGFSNAEKGPYCATSAENMYTELHGLLTKYPQDPLPGTGHLQEPLPSNISASWPQFKEVISTKGQKSTLDDDLRNTAAKLITNKAKDPPSSKAGKSTRSTVLITGRANPERHEKSSSRPDHVEELDSIPLKRCCTEHAIWQSNAAFVGRLSDGKYHASLSGGTDTSYGFDAYLSVGPALNTNGKPRARRGSATDPQSVYARHRRERITERLKILQHLVPNGAKVDIVTMLEEAINYVKFLQLQVRLLSSDEYWIYAPTTYNGVDVSMGTHFQDMGSQV